MSSQSECSPPKETPCEKRPFEPAFQPNSGSTGLADGGFPCEQMCEQTCEQACEPK